MAGLPATQAKIMKKHNRGHKTKLSPDHFLSGAIEIDNLIHYWGGSAEQSEFYRKTEPASRTGFSTGNQNVTDLDNKVINGSTPG
ncbi:MAG: hypothetical protein WD535_06190 [Thermaerobacterales bacterium]